MGSVVQAGAGAERRPQGGPGSNGGHDGHPRGREQTLSEAMLDASRDCVIAIGEDGRIVEWNRAAERTFGHPRDRAVGADLAELIIPVTLREQHRAAVARSLAEAGAALVGQRLEATAVRANGQEFPVELTVTRVEAPEPILVGFVRDISDARHRESERETQERRRKALTSLGSEVLEGATPADVAARAAELVRSELGSATCQIWEPAEGPDRLVLAAAAGWDAGHSVGKLEVSAGELLARVDGSAPAPLAEAQFRPPPEALGGRAIQRGAAHRFAIPGERFGVIAVHGFEPSDGAESDDGFVASLGQILGSSVGQRLLDVELARAERRYRELIERLPVVSYLAEYGPEGHWLYVSPQIHDLLGYTPEEFLADNMLWWERVHPDDRDRVAANEARCARTLEPLAFEYRMIARDGAVVWVHDEGSLGRPADGGAVQVEGVMADVTERKRAEEALRHRAEHDDLTGLPNRRRFEDELRHRRSTPDAEGAVALLDIDSLKYVNDSLGHAAGDALLRGVATSLRNTLASGEVLARFGGDEFAVLLRVSEEAEVRERLGCLVQAVRTRPAKLPATISAGVAVFDRSKTATDEDLLVAADIALHQAKEHGGDRLAVFKGSGKERLAWVEHVRAAIDGDRFLVYAQPIVDARTGEPAGDELLIRMRDADGSVLPPSAFLPTAERFGLIREIDGWMINRAVEVAARGRSVTVNLSARSIADPELTGQVSSALERTGADPELVVFEITETAAATAIEELRTFGVRIEQLGCALAIDDFGTGFGSLTYLKHLPVRYLKVDMEFVRGVLSSAADRAIVHSIVTIAASLGMQTVGEGVEDEATLERLRGLGVDYVQGYHLGRPVPVGLRS